MATDMNDVNPNHKGWDLTSVAMPKPSKHDIEDQLTSSTRRIEVRATRDHWSDWGVGLTQAQYKEAQLVDDFYLYVVEYALDPAKRVLYVFHSPFEKVTDYWLDGSWKFTADETWRETRSLFVSLRRHKPLCKHPSNLFLTVLYVTALCIFATPRAGCSVTQAPGN